MKSTGMVRRIDELGRIVIPIEIRSKLNIYVRDPIEIFTEGSSIVFRKHEPNCFFCNSNQELVFYANKHICKHCANDLSLLI